VLLRVERLLAVRQLVSVLPPAAVGAVTARAARGLVRLERCLALSQRARCLKTCQILSPASPLSPRTRQRMRLPSPCALTALR